MIPRGSGFGSLVGDHTLDSSLGTAMSVSGSGDCDGSLVFSRKNGTKRLGPENFGFTNRSFGLHSKVFMRPKKPR